jgi:hypothetical protein
MVYMKRFLRVSHDLTQASEGLKENGSVNIYSRSRRLETLPYEYFS